MIKATYYFPESFLWGTATSAQQAEGDLNNSWTTWENEDGHIYQNQKSGRACEWRFGRWQEDADRMAHLNTNAHRLSVEWSRIQPEQDTWNEEALEQYAEMLQGFLKRGIQPMVTLHHFTNPLWIENNGGWLNPETVDHFARFVEKTVKALHPYVNLWCTINEPMVYAVQAFLIGMFPPGHKSLRDMYCSAEMLLRAHAVASQVIKARQPDAKVGLAKHMILFDAAFPGWLNKQLMKMPRRVFNYDFIEALVGGELHFPLRRKVTIPDIIGATDYLGLNYYQRYRVSLAPLSPGTYFMKQVPHPDSPEPPPLWGDIYPQGIYAMIMKAWSMTQLPIYITETGVPGMDDNIRCQYIARIVRGIWQAINFNIPVKGLFFWTLMDSPEWTVGYNPQFHFGLYEVNHETQERTLRDSGRFYAAIGQQKGLSADMVRQYAPDLETSLFPGQPGQLKINL